MLTGEPSFPASLFLVVAESAHAGIDATTRGIAVGASQLAIAGQAQLAPLYRYDMVTELKHELARGEVVRIHILAADNQVKVPIVKQRLFGGFFCEPLVGFLWYQSQNSRICF